MGRKASHLMIRWMAVPTACQNTGIGVTRPDRSPCLASLTLRKDRSVSPIGWLETNRIVHKDGFEYAYYAYHGIAILATN